MSNSSRRRSSDRTMLRTRQCGGEEPRTALQAAKNDGLQLLRNVGFFSELRIVLRLRRLFSGGQPTVLPRRVREQLAREAQFLSRQHAFDLQQHIDLDFRT